MGKGNFIKAGLQLCGVGVVLGTRCLWGRGAQNARLDGGKQLLNSLRSSALPASHHLLLCVLVLCRRKELFNVITAVRAT